MEKPGPEIEAMKDFVGTKIALINLDRVLTSLRDNRPDVSYPGMWDLPGGAREDGETPFQTVVREVKEELDLDITPKDIVWEKIYPSVIDHLKDAAFMVANITDEQLGSVVFGDEGQEWKMMPFEEFINHKNVIPGMQTRLRDYLAAEKQ